MENENDYHPNQEQYSQLYSQQIKNLIPSCLDEEIKQYFLDRVLNSNKQEQLIEIEDDCFDLLQLEDILSIHEALVKLKKEYKYNRYFGTQSQFKNNFKKFIRSIIAILKISYIPLITFQAIQIYNIIYWDQEDFQLQRSMQKISKKNGFMLCVCDLLKSSYLLILQEAIKAFVLLFDIHYNQRSILTANKVKQIFDVYFMRLKEFNDVELFQSFLYFLIGHDLDDQDPLKTYLQEKIKNFISDVFKQNDSHQIGQYLNILLSYGSYYLTLFLIDKNMINRICELLEILNIQCNLHYPLYQLVYKLVSKEEFREEIQQQKYFDRINFHPHNPLFTEDLKNITIILKTVKVFVKRNQFEVLIQQNRQFFSRLMSCHLNSQSTELTKLMECFLESLIRWNVERKIVLLFCSKGFFKILRAGLLSNYEPKINNSLVTIHGILCQELKDWTECQEILEELNQMNLESILVSLISKSHMHERLNKSLIYKILNVLEYF